MAVSAHPGVGNNTATTVKCSHTEGQGEQLLQGELNACQATSSSGAAGSTPSDTTRSSPSSSLPPVEAAAGTGLPGEVTDVCVLLGKGQSQALTFRSCSQGTPASRAVPVSPPGTLMPAGDREQVLQGRPGCRLLHGALGDGAAPLQDLVG